MGILNIFPRKFSPPPSNPKPDLPIPSRSSPLAPEKPKGLFGDKGYMKFQDLRQFAKKAPFVAVPKYNKKFTQKERIGLMNSLKKYTNTSYGVSKQKFDIALKKMQKEKMYTKSFSKKKELDQKIKMFQKWKNG
jgi:hypothetical protein